LFFSEKLCSTSPGRLVREKTGKLVGKEFKKGVKIVKAFVKGAEDSYSDKNKKNKQK